MQFLVIIYTRNEKNGCISSDVLRILLNVNGRVKEYKIFTDKARQHVFIFYSGMAQHKQNFYSENVKAKLTKRVKQLIVPLEIKIVTMYIFNVKSPC